MAVEVARAEETFLDVRNLRIRLQRKGQGEPVVVLHGEEGVGQWHPFYERLAQRFQVLVPEHPGFGQSGQPDWLEGIQDLVYHSLEVMEALGLGQVHLVGESFGGWLAAELAVGHGERLKKLVLIDPYGIKPPSVRLPDVFVLSAEQLASATFYDRRLAVEAAAKRPTREELERRLRERATLSRIGWNPYLHNPQLPVWLHRVRVPTLVVWGKHDRLVPLEVAQAWLERLPNARLMVVEDAGHLPQVERAEQVAEAVSRFLLE